MAEPAVDDKFKSRVGEDIYRLHAASAVYAQLTVTRWSTKGYVVIIRMKRVR